MKYYRIHCDGRHIIVLAVGLSIENGVARLHTTEVALTALVSAIRNGLAPDMVITPVQNSDKNRAYVSFIDEKHPVSIEEVTVTSVIPSIA